MARWWRARAAALLGMLGLVLLGVARRTPPAPPAPMAVAPRRTPLLRFEPVDASETAAGAGAAAANGDIVLLPAGAGRAPSYAELLRLWHGGGEPVNGRRQGVLHKWHKLAREVAAHNAQATALLGRSQDKLTGFPPALAEAVAALPPPPPEPLLHSIPLPWSAPAPPCSAAGRCDLDRACGGVRQYAELLARLPVPSVLLEPPLQAGAPSGQWVRLAVNAAAVALSHGRRFGLVRPVRLQGLNEPAWLNWTGGRHDAVGAATVSGLAELDERLATASRTAALVLRPAGDAADEHYPTGCIFLPRAGAGAAARSPAAAACPSGCGSSCGWWRRCGA